MKLQLVSWAVALLCCIPAFADLSGTIVDSAGNGVTDVRVFVEPGIAGAVIEGTVLENGAFSVAGDFYGSTGVFAIAPSHGFGGVHLNIAAGDEIDSIHIVLAPATSVSGTITDHTGAVIAGAQIASIAITHPVKVGIPLSKLTAFGITLPESGSTGNFSIGFVPQGATLALKIQHPRYAQEAVMDVAAGTCDMRVLLYRGVTVRGQVMIQGGDIAVSGAVIAARKAQPPHDTAYSTSDGSGVFSLRLKPGVYLFQAYASGRISSGFQRLDVSGELPEQNLRLFLSKTSVITGTVHDAKTGEPIPGVRVLVEAQGKPAGIVRTGVNGRFIAHVAAGDTLLHFDAVPGYLAPDTQALRVSAPGGDTLELAGLWLVPAPEVKSQNLSVEQ